MEPKSPCCATSTANGTTNASTSNQRCKQAQLRAKTDALLAAPVLGDPDDRSQLVAAAIGDALGVTRQAAFQRYGKPVDPRTGEPLNTTPLPEAAVLAEAVIGDLAAGRWSAVSARFDPAMREGLSDGALAAAWAQIVGQAGAFDGHGPTEAARAADVTITNTPLELEAGDFVARITFRDDQSIAGLYIFDGQTS